LIVIQFPLESESDGGPAALIDLSPLLAKAPMKVALRPEEEFYIDWPKATTNGIRHRYKESG